MKYSAMLIAAMCLFFFSACSDNGAKAEELFETAQFEELQKNREHALQLYTDIIERYPESKFAQKAKVRMAALGK